MAQILYHVGRWIYLADAWDDLAEDREAGQYNPLLARYGDQAEQHQAALRETMHVSLGLANTAYALLDWGVWEPLLGHILTIGLPAVEEAVFTGQWKQAPVYSNVTKLPPFRRGRPIRRTKNYERSLCRAGPQSFRQR